MLLDEKFCVKQDFVLTNGDILSDVDYIAIYKIHQKKSNYITMILLGYDAKIPYGVMEMDEKNNL